MGDAIILRVLRLHTPWLQSISKVEAGSESELYTAWEGSSRHQSNSYHSGIPYVHESMNGT